MKKIGTARYCHVDFLPAQIKSFVAELVKTHGITMPFNVVKLGKDVVSLLHYKNFFKAPHPELLESVTINHKISYRKYDKSNPPILHRKELMIDSSHPLYTKYCNLTAWEETQGWYKNTRIIGRKKQWEKVKKVLDKY